LLVRPDERRARTRHHPAPHGARRRPSTARLALASLLATGALLLLTAVPAAAKLSDDGEQSGPGLSVVQTLLIFAGIPLAVIIIIWILVSVPAKAKGPRYRPGLGWWAAPVWFNGPDNADAAVRSAQPTPIKEGGGASARW
jgi:hypothetical protein